jgi:hypothetical protein
VTDHREPGTGDGRPSDDEMTEQEIQGRDALRELGPAEPLPADVLARLEARLEAEPGLGAPARRSSRRRMPRLAFAAPGIAVALAATVAIVVLANRGQSEPAQDVSALSQLTATTEASTPSASAPKATAGAGASSKYAVAVVHVPVLVGHSLREARALAHTRGLRVRVVTEACASQPAARVTSQTPSARTRVARGSAVRVDARCA